MSGVWDRLHFLVDREVLERRMAIDHLIKNAAQGPYVARSANFKASHAVGELDGFRGHIIHGTNLHGFVSAGYT
jgi:hypothetical protein